MNGILLMCYDSKYYGQFAYNMACSIKALSGIPIHLICDEKSVKGIDLSIFDSYELFEPVKDGPNIDVGRTKIELFERSPFEKTIYLDVDGILLRDPTELFDKLDTLFVQPTGKGNLSSDENSTVWASNKMLRDIGLSGDIYATQTSIIYFDKKAKPFFEKLKENYERRFERTEYKENWGKRKEHPDELYYSITLNQLGMSLPDFKPLFIPDRIEKVGTIVSNYYVLSMLGGWNQVKPYCKDLYDKLMHKYAYQLGRRHLYKAHRLYQNKFVLKK